MLWSQGRASAYLEASEAAAAGKADVADVGRAVGRDHLINNQGAVWQVGPSAQLHLPKLLQGLHHIYCSAREEEDKTSVQRDFQSLPEGNPSSPWGRRFKKHIPTIYFIVGKKLPAQRAQQGRKMCIQARVFDGGVSLQRAANINSNQLWLWGFTRSPSGAWSERLRRPENILPSTLNSRCAQCVRASSQRAIQLILKAVIDGRTTRCLYTRI